MQVAASRRCVSSVTRGASSIILHRQLQCSRALRHAASVRPQHRASFQVIPRHHQFGGMRGAWGSGVHDVGAAKLHTGRQPRLYSAGEGYLGSLGQGDFKARPQLTRIRGALEGLDITDFAAGWAHSAVVTGDGRLFVFGRPHDMRKVLTLRYMWSSVPFMVRFTHVLKRWGIVDNYKKAQDKSREDIILEPREVPLPDGEKAARVSCSGALTVVVTESGRVLCMGHNTFGQCGTGEPSTNVWTPTAVKGLPDSDDDPVVEASAGFQHVVCRTASGRAYAWGKGERGQLGNGAVETHPSAFPVDMPPGIVLSKLSCGFNHSAALDTNGCVWVWGKMQGLSLKESADRSIKGINVYDDQLLPRRLAGLGDEAKEGEGTAAVGDDGSGDTLLGGGGGSGGSVDLRALSGGGSYTSGSGGGGGGLAGGGMAESRSSHGRGHGRTSGEEIVGGDGDGGSGGSTGVGDGSSSSGGDGGGHGGRSGGGGGGGRNAARAVDISCAHFHTAILTDGGDVMMMGMRTVSRTMEPHPILLHNTFIADTHTHAHTTDTPHVRGGPDTHAHTHTPDAHAHRSGTDADAYTPDAHGLKNIPGERRWFLSSAMTRTVLLDRGEGRVYTCGFDGEGTELREEEVDAVIDADAVGISVGGVSGGSDEVARGQEKARVVGMSAGLLHRLLLLA